MFKSIAVPVDLAHTDRIEKAIAVAAGMAAQHDAKLTLIGVAQTTPSSVAASPEAFAEKLKAFAADCSSKHGVTIGAHTEVSHDVTIELDDKLEEAAKKLDADLVVMASHVPGFAEHVFASNAGYLASHATISVFVVR